MVEKEEKSEKINDVFTLNTKYSGSLKKRGSENLFQFFIVLKILCQNLKTLKNSKKFEIYFSKIIV